MKLPLRMAARRVLTVALAAGILIGIPAAASAHALLKSSIPADGATLSSSPKQILMTFTEPPDPTLSLAQVLDSTGHPVAGASKAEPVPASPNELRVLLTQPLPNGVYTVNWRTVSRVDGHVTGAAFAFGIGVAPSARSTSSVGGAPPGPPVLAVVGKWAFYWGLAVLVGAAATGLFVFGGRLPDGARWLLAGGLILSLAGLVLEMLVERAQIGIGLGAFLSSSAGRSYVHQGVALLVAGASAAAFAFRPGSITLWILAAAGMIAMLVHSTSGHADGPSSIRWLNLADEWVHITAVGVWIGGLLWLLLGLQGRASQDRMDAVVRFSFMATVAVIIVVLTGLARAAQELGRVRNLFDTAFGVTLLVKAGIFLILGGIAAVNKFRLVPRLRSGEARLGSLRQTVRSEAVLAVGVIAAAVLLSELAPASFVAAAEKQRAPSAVVVSGSDFATTVKVRLSASPGTVGPNTFSAAVTDYESRKPAPARIVQLEFSLPSQPSVGASTLTLHKTKGGVWQGKGTQLSIQGQWSIDVVVQEASNAVDVPLKLRTKLPPERITASVVPGQPTLYTIQLGQGRTLQTYVDPGKPGPDTVHFTFFEGSNEQSIASARATAITPSGSDKALHLIRFDPGHFASNVTLTPGRWTFQVAGRMSNGGVLSAYFSQVIQS